MSWNFGLFWLAAIWGAFVALLSLIVFIQENGIRRTAVVGGWFGLACLGAVGIGAVALMAIGAL